MKKWIALLLALVMCLALCACGGGDKASEPADDSQDAAETAEVQEEETASAPSFCGTWKMVNLSVPSGDFTVEQMEENSAFESSDWLIVITEDNQLYLQTQKTSVVGDCTMDETSVTAGSNVWNLVDDQLVLVSGDSSFYYEKASDSQDFPEPQKADLLDMLTGTWTATDGQPYTFEFSKDGCTADLNGVIMETNSIALLTDRNQIKVSVKDNGSVITLTLDYTVDGDVLSFDYNGSTFAKA